MMARSVLAAVSLVVLAGCAGQGPGSGPGPGSGDRPDDGSRLLGRTFLSTSVKGHSLVAETRISLSFPEPGKIAARAGCNSLFGQVGFESDKLAVSGMGGTEMGCEPALHDQDKWLMEFLTAGPVWALAGDELVLTLGETEMTLLDREVADPDRPLTGARWQVESLLQGESVSSVPVGAEAFLEFREDGKVLGNTGCNNLSGGYTREDGSITFTPIVTTKKACADDVNALERAVLEVLEGTVTAEITADRLELVHPGGSGLHLRVIQ